MKTPNTLFRLLSAAALAAATALPAAAQVDLTRFVWVGDSEGAGFSAGCLTKRVQVDSPSAVIARANNVADFQQPIVNDPGLGGCMVLTSLAPSFGAELSTGTPANLALPRPYNNLSIPGCAIGDMVRGTSSADTTGTCGTFMDLILRNSALHLGPMIDQANLLNPTFVVLENVGNDYLGAVLSGTIIDGVTITPVASFTADINTAVAKLKSKQANGVVFGVADVTSIPFVTTLPPVLTSGGKVVLNPATGQPIPLLGPKGCPTGVPACPIPLNTLVTLNAAAYLPSGFGIPCAVAPLPNCNKPLPAAAIDAKHPGVLIYAADTALLKQRYADYNAAIKAAATANGYKFYDTNDFLLRMKAGFDIGGATVSAAFLTGGLFSYDGFHLTPLGYALLADDLTKFINANFPSTNLKEPDLSVYLFQGGTAGGLSGGTVPFAWSPLTDAEKAAAIEQIFTLDFASKLAAMFPPHRAIVSAGPSEPARHVDRAPRLDSMP